MKVLLIIPAYNEEENIARLLDRLIEQFPEYDPVVVNDSSTDRTMQVCRSRGVKVIDLPVNLGIGGAVQAGYRYAYYKNYDAAVQVDGDGQHEPEFIKSLLDGIRSGSNLCIGSRFINAEGFKSSVSRRIGISYFRRLIWLFTGMRITDPTSGFRACDRKTISLFAHEYPIDYPEPETLVYTSRYGLIIKEIPVLMSRREKGRSSITVIRSIYYIFKVSLAVIIASFRKEVCK